MFIAHYHVFVVMSHTNRKGLQTKPLDPTTRAFVPMGRDSSVKLKIDISMESNLQAEIRTQGVTKKEEKHVNDGRRTIKIVNPPKTNNTSFLAFCPDANITSIPKIQSVNLLLSGLPPDCTARELLSAIHGYGRIWSVSIHPPSPWDQDNPLDVVHGPTASASLCFFEVAAAHRFLKDVELRGFHAGGGHEIRARYHPRHLPDKEHLCPQSRCVLVEGSPDLVNEASLLLLLRSRLLFLTGRSLAEIKEELVEVRPRYVTIGRNVFELCFHEGFHGRAGLAADVLLLEDNPRIWSVRYGEDPCVKPWLY